MKFVDIFFYIIRPLWQEHVRNRFLIIALRKYKAATHYEKLPMQYTQIFFAVKIKNFIRKLLIFFLFFAQNIDCRYALEPPRQDGSKEYPQSMFWSKNKKNRYTPAYSSFFLYKSGVQRVFISRTCFPGETQ